MLVTKNIFRKVRTAAWKKAAEDRGEKSVRPLGDYVLITEVLNKFFWKDNWSRKIKTCLQNIEENVGDEAHSDTYYMFVLLCKYLGYRVEAKVEEINGKKFYEYDLDHKTLVSKLFDDSNLVTKEMRKEQFNKWRKNDEEDPNQYFNFYCAQADGQIGKGHFTLNFITNVATLKIGPHGHAWQGDIKDQWGNLFLLFDKESKTKMHSYLSLVADDGKGAADADSFYGHFSFSAVGDGNMPFAVKVIALRSERKNPERYEVPEAPADVVLQLTGQIIGNNLAFCSEDLVAIRGHYDGYWFGVGNHHFNYIRFYLHVNEDGRCLIRSPRGDLHGVVVNYKPKQVFECKFSTNVDFSDPFLNIIIEIDPTNDIYYDGIFCRQREHERLLNAGKLRIYRLNGPTAPQKYIRGTDELPSDKKIELDNYFLGRPAGSRSSWYVQPTEDTFLKYFNSLPINIENPRLAQFNGSHTIYRLDSKRKFINRYRITIESGRIRYTLFVKNEEKVYEGLVSFDGYCLKINVFKRGNEEYNALYIFRIGQHITSESEEYHGVYATTNSFGAPVGGRAILVIKGDDLSNVPVELFTNDYYALSPYIRSILTGAEHNLIKISVKQEKFYRKHDYGKIFFYMAINHQLSLTYRLDALIWALEHGFSQIDLIEKYREENKSNSEEERFLDHIDIKRNSWQNEVCTVKVKDEKGKDHIFQIRGA